MHHLSSSHCFCPRVRPRVESVMLGLAVVLGLLLFSGGDYVWAQGGTWVTKTPMPTARGLVMAAGIGGKLYVAGGYIVNLLEVYDPATDIWATKAPMRKARAGAGSAVIGGKLYVAGGWTLDEGDVATLEVYDPVTDTWTTKTPMPTPRRHPVGEAIGGLLYVAGGVQDPGVGNLATLEVYDPATDTWTTKASLPAPRGAAASGVIDGQLYLAGGSTNTEVVATLLVYDPGTNSWTEKTPMPTARVFTAGAVLDGQLYIVTGIRDYVSPPVNTVEVYDPVTDRWSTAPPIPTGRDRLGEIGVVDGKIYVAGGSTCVGCNSPSYDLATLEVFSTLPPPVAFASFAAVTTLALGPQADDDAFAVQATFTLVNFSSGFAPLTDPVRLQVGTLSLTIPAGSFHRAAHHGAFVFEGVIDGVQVRSTIFPPKGNGKKSQAYQFKASGTGANLSGTELPVTVRLLIGDDSGSTTLTEVTAQSPQ